MHAEETFALHLGFLLGNSNKCRLTHFPLIIKKSSRSFRLWDLRVLLDWLPKVLTQKGNF